MGYPKWGVSLCAGTPHGVGPVQPGQLGQLQWGDKIDYKVAFT